MISLETHHNLIPRTCFLSYLLCVPNLALKCLGNQVTVSSYLNLYSHSISHLCNTHVLLDRAQRPHQPREMFEREAGHIEHRDVTIGNVRFLTETGVDDNEEGFAVGEEVELVGVRVR